MAIMRIDARSSFENYDKALQKLGYSADDTFKEMVRAGTKTMASYIRAALPNFRKHIRVSSPRKNQWGWFGQVKFKGRTRTGLSAAQAAYLYNYGHKTRGGGFVKGTNALKNAVEDAQDVVDGQMRYIYFNQLKSLGFDEE